MRRISAAGKDSRVTTRSATSNESMPLNSTHHVGNVNERHGDEGGEIGKWRYYRLEKGGRASFPAKQAVLIVKHAIRVVYPGVTRYPFG